MKNLLLLTMLTLLTPFLWSQETTDTGKDKPPYQVVYDLSATVDLSFSGRKNEPSDLKPSESTPTLELEADILHLWDMGSKFTTGPRVLAFLDTEGGWVPSQWQDLSTGLPLAENLWTYSFSLTSVDYGALLGWTYGNHQKSSDWDLTFGFLSQGSMNNTKKDVALALDETQLAVFTQNSLGAKALWESSFGKDIFFDFDLGYGFLKSGDLNRFWHDLALGTGFGAKIAGWKGEVTGDFKFSNLWLPKLGYGFALETSYNFGAFKLTSDLIKYAYSVYWLDGNSALAVGQKAALSTGLEAQFKGKEWAFTLGLSNTWWALDRTRTDDPRDKPFTITFQYQMKGKD